MDKNSQKHYQTQGKVAISSTHKSNSLDSHSFNIEFFYSYLTHFSLFLGSIIFKLPAVGLFSLFHVMSTTLTHSYPLRLAGM